VRSKESAGWGRGRARPVMRSARRASLRSKWASGRTNEVVCLPRRLRPSRPRRSANSLCRNWDENLVIQVLVGPSNSSNFWATQIPRCMEAVTSPRCAAKRCAQEVGQSRRETQGRCYLFPEAIFTCVDGLLGHARARRPRRSGRPSLSRPCRYPCDVTCLATVRGSHRVPPAPAGPSPTARVPSYARFFLVHSSPYGEDLIPPVCGLLRRAAAPPVFSSFGSLPVRSWVVHPYCV